MVFAKYILSKIYINVFDEVENEDEDWTCISAGGKVRVSFNLISNR